MMPNSVKSIHPVQKAAYSDIMSLYDRAENMLSLAEKQGAAAEPYLKDLKKLVKTMEKSLEVMTDSFFNYMESGKTLSGVEKMKMEKTVKEIKLATQVFLSKIGSN